MNFIEKIALANKQRMALAGSSYTTNNISNNNPNNSSFDDEVTPMSKTTKSPLTTFDDEKSVTTTSYMPNNNTGKTWTQILKKKTNQNGKNKRKIDLVNFERTLSNSTFSFSSQPVPESILSEGNSPKKAKTKLISIRGDNDNIIADRRRRLPEWIVTKDGSRIQKSGNEKKKKNKNAQNPELDELFFNQPMIRDYDRYLREKDKNIALIQDNICLAKSTVKNDLKPHQQYAFEWAMRKERLACLDPTQYEGFGLLADEMGLGKTLVFISLIASNGLMRHKRQDVSGVVTATLYICPTTLLDEMVREVEKHCPNGGLTYKIIQGPTEMKRLRSAYTRDFIDECNEHDILFTNFETVRGLISLFQQVKFLRIIIDEAHYIRNQKTSSFKKIARLRAKYYWCSTGSPISNDMSDLHSLFCIMRSKVFSEPYIWKNYIDGGGNGTVTSENPCKDYKTIMSKEFVLRRQQDILELPECTIHYVYVEFSDIEKCIYKHVWDKTKQQLTEKELEILMSDDIFVKMNMNILEKLLRIRQCCDNYRLLKLKKSDLKLREELRELRDLRHKKTVNGLPKIKTNESLASSIIENAQEQNSVQAQFPYENSLSVAKSIIDAQDNDYEETPAGTTHGTTSRIASFVSSTLGKIGSFCSTQERETSKVVSYNPGTDNPEIENSPCCEDQIFDDAQGLVNSSDTNLRSIGNAKQSESLGYGWLTARKPQLATTTTLSPTRSGCTEQSLHNQTKTENIQDNSFTIYPKMQFEKEEKEEGEVEEASDDDDGLIFFDEEEEVIAQGSVYDIFSSNSIDSKNQKSDEQNQSDNVRKNNVKTQKQKDDKMMDDVLDMSLCNSSKINSIVAKVKELIDENRDGTRKIVIFCQWTEVMRMIGQKINVELKLDTLKIEGSMSREERTKVLHEFDTQPDKRIFLASINCCSHGLNLQVADIGIIVEPWYNPQIEKQAICRLVRIGQKKEVQIFRFIVKDTMEERIKIIQDRKGELAESLYEK